MKFKKMAISFLTILACLTLAGCTSPTDEYEGRVKVVFELEGGIYRNCEASITYYYDFKADTENLISAPETLSGKEVSRAGYTLEGWYETRTVAADGSVTYADKWDFDSDKVTGEGVVLYARWEKIGEYSYNVCYVDEKGETQILGSYTVAAGETFSDYSGYAGMRAGYTVLGYLDEDGETWNSDYVHPGGEGSVAVNVYVDYIQGTYAVVRTASELKVHRTENIYLANDIDFKGAEFSGFGNYGKEFLGNGHTISNFRLSYDATRNGLISDGDLADEGNLLCISLFGNMNGATVKDVAFENVTVDVSTRLSTTRKIFLATLSIKMSNSTIENVTFNGTFSCSVLPNGFNQEENLIVVTDRLYYLIDEKSEVKNAAADITNHMDETEN